LLAIYEKEVKKLVQVFNNQMLMQI